MLHPMFLALGIIMPWSAKIFISLDKVFLMKIDDHGTLWKAPIVPRVNFSLQQLKNPEYICTGYVVRYYVILFHIINMVQPGNKNFILFHTYQPLLVM